MEIEIESVKKAESENKSILKTSIRGPLVVMVLLLTLGLTTLFYFSQDTRTDVYSRYIETLSDYKFLESRVMRPMERSRYSLDEDSAAIEAGLMVLRELAVSVSSSMEGYRQDEAWHALLNRVDIFEREVLNKVSVSRRFLKERRDFLTKVQNLETYVWNLPQNQREVALLGVHSLVLGSAVDFQALELPDSLKFSLQEFSALNAEQATMWSKIDNVRVMLLAEDIIAELKNMNNGTMEWKSYFSLVFYLLSLILLLITLLLYVRVKHD